MPRVELTEDEQEMVVLVFGFAVGAAASTGRAFPIKPEPLNRLLSKFGVVNPEQYVIQDEHVN